MRGDVEFRISWPEAPLVPGTGPAPELTPLQWIDVVAELKKRGWITPAISRRLLRICGFEPERVQARSLRMKLVGFTVYLRSKPGDFLHPYTCTTMFHRPGVVGGYVVMADPTVRRRARLVVWHSREDAVAAGCVAFGCKPEDILVKRVVKRRRRRVDG